MSKRNRKRRTRRSVIEAAAGVASIAATGVGSGADVENDEIGGNVGHSNPMHKSMTHTAVIDGCTCMDCWKMRQREGDRLKPGNSESFAYSHYETGEL
jgi:hypothetical protein